MSLNTFGRLNQAQRTGIVLYRLGNHPLLISTNGSPGLMEIDQSEAWKRSAGQLYIGRDRTMETRDGKGKKKFEHFKGS